MKYMWLTGEREGRVFVDLDPNRRVVRDPNMPLRLINPQTKEVVGAIDTRTSLIRDRSGQVIGIER